DELVTPARCRQSSARAPVDRGDWIAAHVRPRAGDVGAVTAAQARGTPEGQARHSVPRDERKGATNPGPHGRVYEAGAGSLAAFSGTQSGCGGGTSSRQRRFTCPRASDLERLRVSAR